jgi:hypothetical protein
MKPASGAFPKPGKPRTPLVLTGGGQSAYRATRELMRWVARRSLTP